MGTKNHKESLERESELGAGSAEKASGGDETVTRNGTAKDWRESDSPLPLSKNAKEEADGPLRNGTAKDWRDAGAAKASEETKEASSPTGESSNQQYDPETMRGGPFRG